MESSTVTPAAGSAVEAPTLAEACRRSAADHGDQVAFRTAVVLVVFAIGLTNDIHRLNGAGFGVR